MQSVAKVDNIRIQSPAQKEKKMLIFFQTSRSYLDTSFKHSPFSHSKPTQFPLLLCVLLHCNTAISISLSWSHAPPSLGNDFTLWFSFLFVHGESCGEVCWRTVLLTKLFHHILGLLDSMRTSWHSEVNFALWGLADPRRPSHLPNTDLNTRNVVETSRFTVLNSLRPKWFLEAWWAAANHSTLWGL